MITREEEYNLLKDLHTRWAQTLKKYNKSSADDYFIKMAVNREKELKKEIENFRVKYPEIFIK